MKKTKLSLNIVGQITEFDKSVVFASVAQIGWELLQSITNKKMRYSI